MSATVEGRTNVSLYNEFGKKGTEDYKANVRTEIYARKYMVTIIAVTCLAFTVILGLIIAQSYHPELSFFPAEIARNQALTSIVVLSCGLPLAASITWHEVRSIQRLRDLIKESENVQLVRRCFIKALYDQ